MLVATSRQSSKGTWGKTSLWKEALPSLPSPPFISWQGLRNKTKARGKGGHMLCSHNTNASASRPRKSCRQLMQTRFSQCLGSYYVLIPNLDASLVLRSNKQRHCGPSLEASLPEARVCTVTQVSHGVVIKHIASLPTPIFP